MIYQIFILLTVISIMLIWYSFTHTDISYYTDIITSLVSIIFVSTLAHNFFIGIEFNSALETLVQYDLYQSTPLGVMFSSVSVVMLILFVTKILELTHQELDQL